MMMLTPYQQLVLEGVEKRNKQNGETHPVKMSLWKWRCFCKIGRVGAKHIMIHVAKKYKKKFCHSCGQIL